MAKAWKMTTHSKYLINVAVLLLGCLAIYSRAQSNLAKILIYSATTGFRHDSIPTAIEALKAKSASIDVTFDSTEDRTQFSEEVLNGYDALLFLSTTGEVLDEGGKTALQNYLNSGGNFIGVHSASDCLVNTTFYGREIGAYFDYHADLQNATVDVTDPSHPSVSMLPEAWMVQDEMYNFKSDPRAIGAIVVLAANESSYVDNGVRKFNQGTPHPIAWFQTHGAGVESGGSAGRSFYTSLGHLNETWMDELFLGHVLGGISWVLQGNTTRAMNSSALVGNSQASAGLNSSSSSSTALTGATTTSIGVTSAPPTPSSGEIRHEVKMIALALAIAAGLLEHF